ncbi:MAG: leucine-rich repeat domain-containing protein, partial [Clostridium sp.]|nr:leucine-rich repeat domain-containing protein [Clostridium sp.]
DVAVAATCTKNGKTQGSHCSVCGTVITAQKTVTATGHIHTELRNAKAATVSSYGYTGDTYCKDCGVRVSVGKQIEKLQSGTTDNTNTPDNGNNETNDNNSTTNSNPAESGNIPTNSNQTEPGNTSIDTESGGEMEDETISDESYEEDDSEDEEDDTLEVGDMLYDAAGTAEYEVVQITGNTVYVSYNAVLNKKQKAITVPNQIKTEDGTVCKVTAISENAFRNNKYVRQIVLSSNITKIGARAFSGCKKLSSITVKSKKITAKSLSGKAFKGISSKTKIKVPKGKKNSYAKLFCKKGLPKKVKVCNM